jgi:hypothetical protein
MLIRFASIIFVVSLVASAQQATQQVPTAAMHFGEPNYVGVMTEVSPNPTLSENQRSIRDLRKRSFLHGNAKEREILDLAVAKMYCKSILDCNRFPQSA